MSILKNILIVAKAKKPQQKRSSEWAKVREEHLKNHPTCACCGATHDLEVHHILPFSDMPELELDPGNLITLCESATDGIICHLCIGHAGNYTKYNPHVAEDAARILDMIKNRLD